MTNREKMLKCKQVMLEKYGTSNPLQIKEIKDRRKQMWIEKYGVSNPMKLDSVNKKREQTNLEKYGVSQPTQNANIKNKISNSIIATNIERYGVTSTSLIPEVRKKQIKTTLNKYGVESVLNNKEVRDLGLVVIKQKYGVDSAIDALHTDEIKLKAKLNSGKYITSSLEQKLISQKLLNITYTALSGVSIKIDKKNLFPDFVVGDIKNIKKVIELFGCYWHNCPDCKKTPNKNNNGSEFSRIEQYAKVGISCLVIWEHEFKDIKKVIQRIQSFSL